MKILISPGDELIIEVEETDGEFTIKFDDSELSIHANMPDSDGRDGKIYSERFGNIFTNARQLSCDNDNHFKNIRDRVNAILLYRFKVEQTPYLKGTSRFDSFGFDSLSSINLIIAVEKEFHISIDDDISAKIQNLNELYSAIYEQLFPIKEYTLET